MYPRYPNIRTVSSFPSVLPNMSKHIASWRYHNLREKHRYTTLGSKVLTLTEQTKTKSESHLKIYIETTNTSYTSTYYYYYQLHILNSRKVHQKSTIDFCRSLSIIIYHIFVVDLMMSCIYHASRYHYIMYHIFLIIR